MRKSILTALALLTLAAILSLPIVALYAVTTPIDDAGRPMPVVSFIGTGGAGTPTSTTDRFPVDMDATTSSSTDSSGWGRRFFNSAITFQTTDNEAMAFFVDDQTAYVMAGGAGVQEVYRSSNRGVTYTFVGNASVINIQYVFRTTLGRLLAIPILSGLDTVSPRFATNPFGPWTNAPIPGGLPAATRANGGMAQQGSTILFGGSSTVETGHILRSTDDGLNWSSFTSPTGHQGFIQNIGVNNIHNTGSIASPAANVWLTIDNDGRIFRSTDDGSTFAQVQQIGAPTSNTFNGVTCSTATICVAWNNTQVFRSTDAGVVWALVATLTEAPRIMYAIGNGIIVAAGQPDGATGFFRSGDNGFTWEKLPDVAPTLGGCTTGNYTSPSGNRDGAIIISAECQAPAGQRLVMYSPIVGAGNTGVVGESGVRWDISSLGHGGVYQGAGAVNSSLEAWQTTPVQRGTLSNSQTTGAANTAVVTTVVAAANARAHLYRLDARCSAGTAQLTVQDGATTVWSSLANSVTAALFATAWAPGLTGTTNTTMTITLSTCGVGNTGTLTVQADRF